MRIGTWLRRRTEETIQPRILSSTVPLGIASFFTVTLEFEVLFLEKSFNVVLKVHLSYIKIVGK